MAWFREWLHGGAVGPSTGGGNAPTTEDPPPTGRSTPASNAGSRTGSATTPARGAKAGATPGSSDVADSYPGERLGLPGTGPGSVATLARRGAQFVLDALLAGIVAWLFTAPELPRNWSLLTWALLMIVPVAVVGATPAMALLGLRVVRVDRPETTGIGPLWAVVRTASVFFLVPALLVDRDGRGVHDRASRTVVLRTR